MTDAQMRLFVWVLAAAFGLCLIGLAWAPILPWAVAFAGVVFAVYVVSVLMRARGR